MDAQPGPSIADAAEPPQQCLGLEPRARTGSARGVAAVLRQQHADVHLVGLGLEPREEALRAVPDLLLPRSLAVDHPAALLVGEVAPRHVERNAALAGELFQVFLALAVRLRLPGPDRAAAQRLRRIGHHEPVVDADDPAEAAAGLAGAERRIEREQARRGIAIVDVAVGAVQVRRVPPRRATLGVHGNPPPPDSQRGLDRLEHATRVGRPGAEPVLHHLEPSWLARVDARVALLLEQREHLGFAEIRRHGHREREHQPGVARGGRARPQVGGDAVRRVPAHRPATAAAVQPRRPGVQQLQVVVELGHGPHGRARGPHRVGLVDGDRRGDALDPVHLRLVHAIEELPCVGREGLDVAALALRVNGVEHQRGLARP